MDKVLRAGLLLLLLVSTHISADEKIIGILDIPSLFDTALAEKANSESVAEQTRPRRFNVRDEPGLDSRVIATVAEGGVLANHEFAYEQTGALVYAYQHIKSDTEGVGDAWYKVFHEPSDAYVWLNLHPEMSFHWLSWLLVDSLVYTNDYWDGVLLDSLGEEALPVDLSGLAEGSAKQQISASVIQFDKWKNQEWMLVVLFEESPCLSARQQPKVVAAGWMRVYADDQRVNAWYSSRGC